MKKVGAIINEKIISDLKDRVKQAQGCFFVSFNKISSLGMTGVRNDLHRIGARVTVTKNTLIAKAFNDLGIANLECINGSETGVVTVSDQHLVDACKVLDGFSKANESFALKGGVLDNKLISKDDVASLAKLPSRQVLLGMVVGAIAAPLSSFVGALNQIPTKLVCVLEEIKKKKEA